MNEQEINQYIEKEVNSVREELNLSEFESNAVKNNIHMTTEKEIQEMLEEENTEYYFDVDLSSILTDYTILSELSDMINEQEKIYKIKEYYGMYALNRIFITENGSYVLSVL